MIRYEAIIIGFNKNTITQNGIPYSALITVHGKTLIEWVIDAVRSSTHIKNITVIGPVQLDGLLLMRYVNRRIAPVSLTVKTISELLLPDHDDSSINHYIIIPAEAVYLSGKTLDTVISEFEASGYDTGFPVIDSSKISDQGNIFPKVKIKNKEFIAGVLALSKSITTIWISIKELISLHQQMNLIEPSFFTSPTAISMQSGLLPEYSEGYFHTQEQSAAMVISTQPELDKAFQRLSPPYSPAFNKVKLIINPGSGRGTQLPKFLDHLMGVKSRQFNLQRNVDSYQTQIIRYLQEFGLKPEVYQSRSAAEATMMARACAQEGYDLVIAAGGDGTINSVINGLAETQTALGVIPLGTLNLFALQFNIPMDIQAACHVIAKGQFRSVDLGLTHGRYFSILCGIGFDAYVISSASKELKKKLGAGVYILTGLKSLFKYRFRSIHFLLDDNPQMYSDYILIVSNGNYYSSNILISEKAAPDDGLLDIIGFQKRNSLSILRYLWELKSGNLTELPYVEYFQARKIKVLQHGHQKMHLDGEPAGYTPATISVVPSALRVVC